MNEINSAIGLDIMSAEDMTSELLRLEDSKYEEEGEGEELTSAPEYSGLVGEIRSTFEMNKRARESSGMEEEIFRSLRANNGEYDPEDLRAIEIEGGSSIYMNLTPTKIRAAQSWIKDILLTSTEDSYSLEPTPLPSLPGDLEKQLEEAFVSEYENAKKQMQEAQQQGQQGPITPKQAQETILELNRNKRDIKEAVLDEINTEAKYQMYIMEQQIKDDMKEGGWDKALANFIEDFCIFPAAFMKGPVITKKEKQVWEKGKSVVRKSYCFLNKRVNPADIYPSDSATEIGDGNLCEIMRLSEKELYDMKDLPNFFPEAIDKVIEDGPSSRWMNSNVEYELAEGEKRGSTHESTKGLYYAIHYWGVAKTPELEDLTILPVGVEDPNKCWEIEAILVNNEIVRAKLNTDPLKRRPYYKASYQNIPGSFWGRSLPNLMRDIQRMCNACARALANNMGLSSGPQVEVYIDRLADSGDIEDMKPNKIWQVTTDPTGAGGRAVNFFQTPSIANELMGVYDKFEQKADDATGIPRYSYGNEKVGGAAQTAQGLSMLMESATKSIKDAIRHIDEGLIKPRIAYQFHWHLIKNDVDYTGDINVIAHASNTLTMKGAQAAKRQEFLQITANEADQRLMGPEGRAELIRELAKDLNLRIQIVPSRLELKRRNEEEKAQAQQSQQQQMQMEAQKSATGVEIAKIQGSSAQSLGEQRNQIELQKMQQSGQQHQDRMLLERERIQSSRDGQSIAALGKAQDNEVKREIARTKASVDIAKG